jgi:hypothetical protein
MILSTIVTLFALMPQRTVHLALPPDVRLKTVVVKNKRISKGSPTLITLELPLWTSLGKNAGTVSGRGIQMTLSVDYPTSKQDKVDRKTWYKSILMKPHADASLMPKSNVESIAYERWLGTRMADINGVTISLWSPEGDYIEFSGSWSNGIPNKLRDATTVALSVAHSLRLAGRKHRS